MYKNYIIILFLFSAKLSFGQTDQELAIQSALQARTIQELNDINGKWHFIQKHSDSLNYGIIQSNFLLARKRKSERIGLLTLTKNSEIIYSEIYNWDFNEDFSGWKYNKVDSSLKEGFEINSINTAHLVRLPLRSTFGYYCYSGGGMPESGQQMMKLVKNSNLKELEKWLNSVNPVLQAYSYLGFSLLIAKGIHVSNNILLKMDELESIELRIYTCSGCTNWGHTPISEMLSSEEVDRFVTDNLD